MHCKYTNNSIENVHYISIFICMLFLKVKGVQKVKKNYKKGIKIHLETFFQVSLFYENNKLINNVYEIFRCK